MMMAKGVRIGDNLITGKGKREEASRIKRLHEVCAERTDPHVHIVHANGSLCVGFRAMVRVNR